MGLIGGLIVGIVGIVLTITINMVPADIFSKIIPICWIPGTKCVDWYCNMKSYLIVIILTIIILFIPFA